jgi:hypothetical protein
MAQANSVEVIMSIVQNVVKNSRGQNVSIAIEVEEKQGVISDIYGETRSAKLPEKVKDAFSSSMGLIHTCAEQIAYTLSAIPAALRPKECEVQLSIKIDAEVGAVIAKSSTEAQFQVTLRWGPQEKS